jgi:enoyl-[acyl-carrier-protein] reductase (NADH)
VRAAVEQHALWQSMTVLRRMGTVEEFGAGGRYLLSDEVALSCGPTLLMDGGYVLR